MLTLFDSSRFNLYRSLIKLGIIFSLFCFDNNAFAQQAGNPESLLEITPTPYPTPFPTPISCPAPQCYQLISQLGGCECCPDDLTWDGTQCIAQCSLWSIRIRMEGDWGYGTEYNPPEIASGVSDWFSSTVDRITRHCVLAGRMGVAGLPKTMDFDDCMVSYFLGPNYAYSYLYWQGGTLNWIPLNRHWQMASDGITTTRVGGTFILNENHEIVVNPPPSAQICDAGTYGWRWSPISLLWGEDVEIDQNITYVNFPLIPSARSKWFIWKASGVAPLLVYDPTHRGEIVSGEQLFGNWTFGGKRIASLGENGAHQQAEMWRDGYEALASLDINKDNQISSKELEPLALWFDNNQNAISESGEVKLLTEVGVTTLFFKPNRVEAATNNIIASMGFERIKDGQRIFGASVDWHSDYADTKYELVNKHLGHSSLCNKVKKEVDDPATEDIQAEPLANVSMEKANSIGTIGREMISQSSDNTTNLSGLWLWVAEDSRFQSQEFIPQGYLGIKDLEDQSISGHTYNEMYFRKESKIAKTMFNISYLTGRKSTGLDGRIVIDFIIDAQNGTSIVSNATLSLDGNELRGHSIATTEYSGKPVSIRYGWYAVRKTL